MPQLVAVDLAGGDAFVDALQRIWDAGDAALPIDRRLPPVARADLLAALAPARVVDGEGIHRLDGGVDTESGDALVVATSGSTGAPKGVVLTHDAVAASARATSARLTITNDDRWLACLPLAHVGGLGVVTRALITGTPLVVHDGFDADAVETAAHDGATAVSLVPTALRRIDPSLFRVIVLGGSHPPLECPANCVTTYGMTETGGGVVYDGRPLDGVDVRIADDGEIQVRGPMLLRAYRGTPADALDSGGWLATGDLGRWLDDDRLHVDGRRSEMIVSGGENVWPDRVEAVLVTHPGVADAAVRGEPDAEWGQRVVAWIVPRGPEPPTLAELKAHVATTLPAFMAPRQVHVVVAIQRTSLGKTARQRLAGPR